MTTAVRPPATPGATPTTRGTNFYLADPNLEFVCSTVMRADDFERARPQLLEMGAVAGSELDALAASADRNPPQLRAWDAGGVRIDEIVRHPAYVEMERLAFSRFGLAAMSHRPDVLGWTGPAPHVVKYALSYLFGQSEFGILCPVSVTDSTSRMLRLYGSEELKSAFLPRLTTTNFAELWQGTQWMTEKSGGSDVGASTTIARRDEGGTWRLWGDKWFCSNANADVALTLARPDGAPIGTKGLGMFLVPKYLPDGAKNTWTINRLKDKLGSRSMATAEVTYTGAVAYVVGDLTRGFRQMMEMVNVSRLSNAMRAAAIMRRSLLEAVVHARARAAFGRALIELPLLRANILDMLLDSEAALSVVLNTAAVLDGWDAGSSTARTLFRILTPLAKYWITARTRTVAGEGMNVRGGNGYVEEWINSRLVRDSYLGAIWEGSTNVVALDVQRAIVHDGCHRELFRMITERLAQVTDAVARPCIVAATAALGAIERQIVSWEALSQTDRELRARPVADALYHILAASVLLAEGQVLHDRCEDFHKFLTAALYTQRWLQPTPVGEPAFASSQLAWVDALIDWAPIPRNAVEGS